MQSYNAARLSSLTVQKDIKQMLSASSEHALDVHDVIHNWHVKAL